MGSAENGWASWLGSDVLRASIALEMASGLEDEAGGTGWDGGAESVLLSGCDPMCAGSADDGVAAKVQHLSRRTSVNVH